MKTAIVFYSLEGNTRFIAEVLAENTGADLIELQLRKPLPEETGKKFMWGGMSVLFHLRPKLRNEKIDLGSYENLLIGTPIWAGSYASPLNTFLHTYKITGKNVALFACMAGDDASKCFRKLKKTLKGNTIMGEISFVEPLKKGKEESRRKATEWLSSLHLA